ncbi:MAG: hypothetical protein JXA81_09180 [Sedimentisphaerales bacterium]|nr:hypothetical protein [Sedimentisphaerales bacterium]
MKRLIITIMIGILITSLAGCVGYRHHRPHGRQVVVVTNPKPAPMPPAPRRSPRGRPAPPPIPRHDHHRY